MESQFTTSAVSLLSAPNVRLQRHHHRDAAQIEPRLRNALRRLIAGEERWPLFLHGAPGLGKSCAALAMCDRMPSAIYLTVSDLCGLMFDRSKTNLFETITSKTLAVLDEIGPDPTSFHCETICRFADARQILPTIFISNLNTDQVEEIYEGRAASRLLRGSCYELHGEDRRRC